MHYKILPLSNISADIYISIHNKFQSRLSDRKIPLPLAISNLRISDTGSDARGKRHLHVDSENCQFLPEGLNWYVEKCVSSFKNISYMHGITRVTKKWYRGRKGRKIYISMFERNEMRNSARSANAIGTRIMLIWFEISAASKEGDSSSM